MVAGRQQRRRYLVKGKLQFCFIRDWALLSVFQGILVGVLVSFVVLHVMRQETNPRGDWVETTATMLGFLLALFVVVSVLHALFVSHQVAGPLCRLEREMERIGNGDLRGSVRFRDRDSMDATAVKANEMLRGLRGLVGEDRRRAGDVLARTREMQAILGGESPTLRDLNRAREHLSEIAGQCEEMTRQFMLHSDDGADL